MTMDLAEGVVLQNRYRILRRLGGGGMGVVYLADDLRLPGRHCAIKEMSPAALAAQDREYAIQAFRQEAQMLATLKHTGLAAVTDFFPDGDNLYLVMEYVEGESLEQKLKAAPQGRLTTSQALAITRQLCDVLEYLHSSVPPVIFRDLKPTNVMVLPSGQVKLIDFGIARFFKSGRTADTLNMGTPGYAAPEQYGGMGQSDPRTDVYSLGVLLYRMITGYNPGDAVTPFSLPPTEQLVPDVQPHVAAAISRAKQMQPDLRFGSVAELRTALLSPDAVSTPIGRSGMTVRQQTVTHEATQVMGTAAVPGATPAAKPPVWKSAVWVILGLGGIGLCIVAVLVGILVWNPFDDGGLPAELSPSPTATLASALVGTASPTPSDELTATSSPPPDEPSTSPTLTPEPSPQPTVTIESSSLGRSVLNRDLSLTSIGYDAGSLAVVVVGAIQGDQPATRQLVDAVADHFEADPSAVPANVRFYFVPLLNPDGLASGSRFNAREVDLNRNWGSSDWVANAAVPGYPSGKPGAGGSSPFSEPETLALRNLLEMLRGQGITVRMIVLHTSVRLTKGEVYPGGSAALQLAQRYVDITGYDIESAWADYVTSGEAVTWCDEQGFLALDIVFPANQTPTTRVLGERTLLSVTIDALISVAQ